MLNTTVNFFSENGLGLVQIAPHVNVLRPLGRKHERHRGVPLEWRAALDALGIPRLQELDCVLHAIGHQDSAIGKSLSPLLQRKRHIGQSVPSMRCEKLCEAIRRAIEC